MTAGPDSGIVHLAVSEPLPIEAAAGGDIVLTARASCPAGHDRRGMAVMVAAPGADAATQHALAIHEDGISETAEIVLKAPPRLGELVVRLVLPAHEIAGVRFPQATLDVPAHVRPQATSLAVWDVPSPVVAGTRFTVRTGAKSSADCTLASRAIEICDSAGAVIARGTLGDAPLPGTGALYWTEIELMAPAQEGLAAWSLRFAASDLDLPHEGAATQFSVAVVPPPDHVLSVKLVERATAEPIADAELRLVEARFGAYRGTTGPSGLAEIALPRGRYELSVWKVGFDAPPQPLDITADAFVRVEALVVPEEDPDARWKM